MSKKLMRLVRMIAVLTVIFLMMASLPYASVKTNASSVSSLEAEKKELQAKAAELERKKDSLSDDLEDQKEKKATIEKQIAVKEEEIALNDDLIYAVDKDIQDTQYKISKQEQEIEDKQTAISTQFASLQERLRIVSKTGNMSVLQMLFDTDSYVDYLLKSKLMKVMSKHDEDLIAKLEVEISKINEQKEELKKTEADLDQQKSLLESIRKEADSAKEDLEALYDEAASVANDLQADINYYDEQIALTEEQEAALEAEIQSILRNSSSSNGEAYKGGKMYWPSKSCHLITDVFGWRMLSGASNFHKGIDICCGGSAYGKDIIAADDGIVIYANGSDSWGSGYGYYVMVDHGIDARGYRIVTVYAHMSSVYVYEGQRVYGGETQLGAIGDTGWSYGSHLHFEVREDGSPVNPLGGYVSPP